jgi:3-hydroxyacyl-CoA dehydrogenase
MDDEAVPEILDVKKQIFGRLDALADPDAGKLGRKSGEGFYNDYK